MSLIRLTIAVAFLVIVSPVWANLGDSLSIKTSGVKVDSTSLDTADMLQTTFSKELVYSSELLQFENNQLPVDRDLFNYHTNLLEFEIPMTYNYYVRRQLNYYATDWQIALKRMVTQGQYVFPFYEEILDKYDMPLEIKYLSIIESALNPFARSRSGAVGPWQFMPATGKALKLNYTYSIDERRSVEKSTEAACKYLKQMYSQFGDWQVALASYNCGPGNVRKAIRNSGKRDFWGMYHHLPRQTQNYVPKFIAMAYLMNYYDEYGITALPLDEAKLDVAKVYSNNQMNFSIIASELGMTASELLKYNPELKRPFIPYGDYGTWVLTIPKEKESLYYALLPCIVQESKQVKIYAQNHQAKFHTVRKGESLPVIARKYGCSVTELKQWNNLRGSLIYPNQKLKVNSI